MFILTLFDKSEFKPVKVECLSVEFDNGVVTTNKGVNYFPLDKVTVEYQKIHANVA